MGIEHQTFRILRHIFTLIKCIIGIAKKGMGSCSPVPIYDFSSLIRISVVFKALNKNAINFINLLLPVGFVCFYRLPEGGRLYDTRSIGARTKVMGRKNFQESINYCFHKQKVTVFSLHNMYVDEFRGDPLLKTARKYIHKRNG